MRASRATTGVTTTTPPAAEFPNIPREPSAEASSAVMGTTIKVSELPRHVRGSSSASSRIDPSDRSLVQADAAVTANWS